MGMTEEPEDESTEARFRRVQEELRAMELPEIPDERLDERVRSIREQGPTSLPEVPDMATFESRTRKAQGTHRVAKAQEETRLASDAKANKGLGVGLAIAYTLLGLPMVGLGVGYLLDRALGATLWKGVGTLVGAVAGIAFAVVVLNRENSRL